MSGGDKNPQGISLMVQWLVKTLHFHCRGHRFDPGQGTKIPAAWQKKQKNKKTPSDFILDSELVTEKGRHSAAFSLLNQSSLYLK